MNLAISIITEVNPATALDWATRAIAIFNTIIFVWLGATIGLNAERRRWGAWMLVAGLALAGIFFAVNSVIVGQTVRLSPITLDFWWPALWLPFLALPALWYLAQLWYAGALATDRGMVSLAAVGGAGGVALILWLIPHAVPGYFDLLHTRHPVWPEIGALPIVFLIFPLFSLLCFGAGIMALRNPAPATGEENGAARERARPWLMRANGVLVVIALTTGCVALWAVANLAAHRVSLTDSAVLAGLVAVDGVVSLQIAAVVIMLGQAIAAYAIFTGKALPQGDLTRQWQSTLLLAASYSVIVAATLDFPIDPLWRLLLATTLMTLCYALLGRQSYTERRRGMERLRPFVTSQGLYDALLHTDDATIDSAAPFTALCATVLTAQAGYLIPLGALATLTGGPLTFPAGRKPPSYLDLVPCCVDPDQLCLEIDPAPHEGAIWAIPLWSGVRLIGLLLLGPKIDGEIYTQEEIEIARAACERLLDTQASAALARRLMTLQRQRLAESQVIDQRTRRVLHDDVLPLLHAALLRLNGATPSAAGAELAEAHRLVAQLLHDLPAAQTFELAQQSLLNALRQITDHSLAGQFDSVIWDVASTAETAALNLPPLTAEVLYAATREALRNAARHGRGNDPNQPLRLTLTTSADSTFTLTIVDDGVGHAAGGLTAGTGHGLALHATLLAIIGGTLAIEPNTPHGTRIILKVPAQAPKTSPSMQSHLDLGRLSAQ